MTTTETVAAPSMGYAKLGFFGHYFGTSTFRPYFSLLLETKGFGKSTIGVFGAVTPLMLLSLLPPLSFAADKHHFATKVFVIGAIVVFASMLVLAHAVSHLAIAASAIVLFAALTPLSPFYDQHVMALLGPERKREWGTFRVFGAYGWALGAPLAALMVDHFGWGYIPWHYAVGASIVCCVMVSHPAKKETATVSYGEVWKFALTHPRIATYLACAVGMGAGYTLIATYLFLFLDELNAPKILMGISITLTVAIEIPLFRNSKTLHEKFSDEDLFSAAMLGWIVRVVGYSFLTNPWYVLVYEPLHGFSFGLMWLSGVHCMSTHFPPSLTTSAFGFYHSAVFGLGAAIGSVGGGALYDTFGSRAMFRIAAAIMTINLLVFRYLVARTARSEKQHLEEMQKKKAEEEDELSHGLPESPLHHAVFEELPPNLTDSFC